MKSLTSALILFLLASGALAEPSGSLPFLKMAPDARSVALGEAGIAGSDGPMAAFHNPALLAFSEQSQAAFAYSDWLLDLSLQSGALLFDYSKFSAALSFNSFTTPDIERRVLPSDQPLETFSAHDMAAGLSLSCLIRHNLSLGVTGRFLYQQIYVEEASGLSADLGVAYHPAIFPITFAAALRNIGKMNELQQEETPLPSNIGAGVSGQILAHQDFALQGLADALIYFDDDLRIHAGLEGSYKNLLFLRLGYQTGSELRKISAGAGLSWTRFAFDYAYQPLSEDFEASHRFTLSITF